MALTGIAHELWLGFAGGIVSFPHCAGMCGGLMLHFSQHQDRRSRLLAQVLWLMGKLSAYLFLGALAGYAGHSLTNFLAGHAWLQNLFAYLAAGGITVMALSLLGLLPVRGNGRKESAVALLYERVVAAQSPGAALMLGVLTAALPCPIVVAYLTYCLASSTVLSGMAVMGALGIGTAVPLLVIGSAAGVARGRLRRWGPRGAAALLLFLGISTALRATPFYHKILGCPEAQSLRKNCCSGEDHGGGHGK